MENNVKYAYTMALVDATGYIPSVVKHDPHTYVVKEHKDVVSRNYFIDQYVARIWVRANALHRRIQL